jgi:tetratricopeptide (TPR) repeat protein
VAQIPQGYHDIPDEDRKKAKVFFDRAKTVADTGNYEYAIEMYLQGLALDPEETAAHQAMRDISLKRKASGGKTLGMFERMKLKPGKDDKQNLLNAEKLLAYDPGNTDYMLSLMQSAHKGGYYDTVLWVGPILQKANADSTKPPPDYNKFITLRDIYIDLKQWKRATEACQFAVMLRPDDMDLHQIMKNLGAQDTMDAGKYGQSGSFRDSVRDADLQDKLLQEDKDVRSKDSLRRAVLDAEKEHQAEPEEAGKLMKLVDALVRIESPEDDARAIELLEGFYQKTKQFRFRHTIGRIRLADLARQDRAMRQSIQAAPNDEATKKDYREFLRGRYEQELTEYQLWAENYPTDMSIRFEVARRLFMLERYGEAIPVFQQARQDPKHRVSAGILLGRAFLEAGFVDEAADTLKACMDEYQVRGDDKAKDIAYWYARSLEVKGELQTALRSYSQVAQWDFNYRDVQNRIKKLRSGVQANGA